VNTKRLRSQAVRGYLFYICPRKRNRRGRRARRVDVLSAYVCGFFRAWASQAGQLLMARGRYLCLKASPNCARTLL
jgi:hypothetical protein